MERFFEEGTLTNEEATQGLRRAVAQGKLFPVLCASALTNVGIQPILDAIVAYAPSPADRPFPAVKRDGSGTVDVPASKSAPYSAFVWRTVADPFAGRITLYRVVSGSLKQDSTVYNVTRDTQERLGHLLVLQGKTHTSGPRARGRRSGGRRQAEGDPERRHARRQADAVHVSKAGLRRAGALLRHRAEVARRRGKDQHGPPPPARGGSDDSLQPRSPDQGVAALGSGSAHIEVTVAKLRRRFGVEVTLKLPRIPYRETITCSGRRARPPQEADRRPRAVRRLQDQRRAARARQGLRVRRRDLRRLHPAPVRPGRREGHPGRPHARVSWPATRWWTSAPRSTTARSIRSTRTSSRSRWRARSPTRTRCRRPGRRFSSR